MPTIDISEFVVLERIPVLETGIDYPASTGNVSITRPMIQEIIAYTMDPHGKQPRIKIAHGDTPINDDLQSLFEQYNEGRDASQPSLGTITNLAVENDGHTLVGDWYGLPQWLALILSSAYPSRSIEGGSWTNPANQKTYEFMVEAISLLGVVGPGCTSLADLQTLFSTDGPKVTVIEMSRPKTDTKMGGSATVPAVDLQVNVEELRREFYGEFAQGDRWWWWDRELLAEPWEFVAMDEEGNLWVVPFVPKEDQDGDTIVESWGDPEPIKVTYVPDPKRQGETVQATRLVSTQMKRTTGTLLAVNTTPPKERAKKEASAAVAIDIKALRSRLNLSAEALPDDASEEQINEALTAEPETPETETKKTETETAPETKVEETEGNAVTVDAQAYRDQQARLARLEAAENKRDQQAQDNEIAQAILERKIPPSRKDHYMGLMKKDPEGTKEFLSKLEKNAVPGPEMGHSGGDADTSRSQEGTGFLPELEKQGV